MPIVLLRGSPTVVVPFYVDLPYAIANPFALADIVSPCVGGTIQELTARQAGWRCTASRCATSSPRRRGPCAVRVHT